MRKFLVLMGVLSLMACSNTVDREAVIRELEVDVVDMVDDRGCLESGGQVLETGECDCQDGYYYGNSSGLCVQE